MECPFPQHPFCRPCRRHCLSIPFPQRQQIPRIGAVVVPHFLLRPFYSFGSTLWKHSFGRGVQFPTFLNPFGRSNYERRLLPVLPRAPFRKVPTDATFRRHLLGFVMIRPASEAFLCGLVLNARPEGAGERAVSPPPSRFRYVSVSVRVGSLRPYPGFLSLRCRFKSAFVGTFR